MENLDTIGATFSTRAAELRSGAANPFTRATALQKSCLCKMRHNTAIVHYAQAASNICYIEEEEDITSFQ
jgi:hypothetical protein